MELFEFLAFLTLGPSTTDPPGSLPCGTSTSAASRFSRSRARMSTSFPRPSSRQAAAPSLRLSRPPTPPARSSSRHYTRTAGPLLSAFAPVRPGSR